jgi:peptidoglycan/xylan/chitin deacetylase (PgdA/CDA1 family)
MLKRAIKRTITTSPGWQLGSVFRRPELIILTYHRVGSADGPFPALEVSRFRRQMEWIKRRCTVIVPEEVPEYARTGRQRRPAVLVTFDDGYRDYYQNAYPVLHELRIPALMFLATSFMDHGGMLWTDQVHWAATASRVATAALPWDRRIAFDLRHTAQREAFTHRCKTYLKAVADAERRRWLLALMAELGVAGREDEVERQMLSWDEVRATAELTRYGGHTHTHPIMSRLDPVDLEREVRLCRDRIVAETGVAPRYFAYPNGGPDDFSEPCKTVLRQHGFELGFTTIEGANGPDADPLALRRIPTRGVTLEDFAWLVGRAVTGWN